MYVCMFVLYFPMLNLHCLSVENSVISKLFSLCGDCLNWLTSVYQTSLCTISAKKRATCDVKYT